jgi:hypothetical protein
MDAGQKSFSQYFPVSGRGRKWGWYVTTAGETRLLPGQTYPPPGHPKSCNFDWSKGRVLASEFCFESGKDDPIAQRLLINSIHYLQSDDENPNFAWHLPW